AYFVFPLAQGTPGKQCGLAATGDYQPSLRSPWLAANAFDIEAKCTYFWITVIVASRALDEQFPCRVGRLGDC
ncbi:hypothetical protein, partial [Thiolapillus sp.]|uniref:hypothetical protein n=1 Tax=Thiolapillus sp. TaxID=2017437 RepID=UPI003AF5C2C0